MRTLGETLYLWRRERGLTQVDLARSTGLSRPNLSAIEQGRRDVTVSTVNRLAEALRIRAGILVDGVCPGTEAEGPSLDRGAFDRIARWMVGRRAALSRSEREVARALKGLMKRKLGVGKQLPSSRDRTAPSRPDGAAGPSARPALVRAARDEEYFLSSLRAKLTRSELNKLIGLVSKYAQGMT